MLFRSNGPNKPVHILDIFIHQNGSKKEKKIQTSEQYNEHTKLTLYTLTKHYSIGKMYWPNLRIY